MADRVITATRRAIAEHRLRDVADRLAKASGVEYVRPMTPANRYPDVYAAELVERVSDFMERLLEAKNNVEESRNRGSDPTVASRRVDRRTAPSRGGTDQGPGLLIPQGQEQGRAG